MKHPVYSELNLIMWFINFLITLEM